MYRNYLRFFPDRLEHARRLRALLAECGLKYPEAAKHLHVSLRTLQNWLCGRHQIPWMVFRVLRLERFMELPSKQWAGWHFSGGKLVTPEGWAIAAHEGAWWSMLVRQARGFGELFRERVSLLAELSALRHPLQGCVSVPLAGGAASDDSPIRSGVPVTRHFSLTRETFGQNLPRYEMRQTTAKAHFELSRGAL
ncbi:Homeodomain-like domain-containing protein [Polaromonas sp. OV174]|uniref:VC1465 family Xer recombination activation factor n=1 Tax=Polaromonas sp. OV174 TaxID=1855300 RepID=UPI0008EE704B|nr:VC1465 family Xer recombination activation factor [Polaromonas sp. OV174]SFC26349.1 Homeodomain-like domain-containing protein [Polaromonas sp. OV174]